MHKKDGLRGEIIELIGQFVSVQQHKRIKYEESRDLVRYNFKNIKIYKKKSLSHPLVDRLVGSTIVDWLIGSPWDDKPRWRARDQQALG